MNNVVRKGITLGVLLLAIGCAHVDILPVKPNALVIAEDGEARMTIVVSSDASPATRYAAEELQRFLGEMTHAEIPLTTDDAPPAPSEIWVGESKRLHNANILIDYEILGNEGYVIRTRDPHIFIAGGEPDRKSVV